MGLPDSYKAPADRTAAYNLIGDGVAVPVVRFLAEHILEPILQAQRDLADSAKPIAAQ
jgi:DNA (cytosine-5)-methyltransferase 1